MSVFEIEEAVDEVRQLHGWLAFARNLQRGDRLPPGVTWFKRENRWWIRVNDETSVATDIFDH